MWAFASGNDAGESVDGRHGARKETSYIIFLVIVWAPETTPEGVPVGELVVINKR